jgi:hypothetical protein
VGVHYDLSSPEGRREVFGDETELPGEAEIVSLRLSQGDDASCLNMQRPETPTVMGVPRELYERDRFGFTKLSPMADDLSEDGNPWHLLEREIEAGQGEAPVIPAFADSASAQWILKVGVGDEVEVPGLGGRPVRLRIVGLLEPSVFQGVLLVSESDFLQRFGSESGYQFFLVGAPPGQTDAAVDAVRTSMSEFGVTVRRTSEVLASYARVQNTYLATFRTLGGLGLLLGTFGIVTVLLRAVVERRREMAMLMAVGLRRGRLSGMIIIENGMLLILGIVVGGAAALVAVAPHLASAMADVNWVALAVTLGACLAVGLASCAIAASLSMQGDLLPALRSE